jgi:ferredoxin-NADP reductase
MHPSTERAPQPRPAWRTLWETAARRWFLDRHVESWLQELTPTASLHETRARIVDIVEETHDTRTFVLAPNARWQGHLAGQHVTLAVDIDGVRTRRCYSLSSAPAAPFPTLTVKRVPGGRVSTFLHDRVQVGDVVRLEAVGGAFTAPGDGSRPLLFLAAGSGITPVLSILDDLGSRGGLDDTVLVYCVRSVRDVIGRARLDALLARHPGLTLRLLHDDDPAGGFQPALLDRAVPAAGLREAFQCGPPGWMALVQAWWDGLGTGRPIHREAFTLAVPPPQAGASVRVTLRDGRVLQLCGEGTLLEQLERAGLSPPHGCRMGICRTCTCRKVRGVVEDLRTGATRDAPDEDVSPCISVPRSDLTLDL